MSMLEFHELFTHHQEFILAARENAAQALKLRTYVTSSGRI